MIEKLKEKLEKELPGSKVEILDPMNDGQHLQAIVSYAGFEGKPLLEQHRMVKTILKEELKEELHSISIQTKTE